MKIQSSTSTLVLCCVSLPFIAQLEFAQLRRPIKYYMYVYGVFLVLDERKRFEMWGPAGAAALSVFFIALTYLNAEKNVSVSCL